MKSSFVKAASKVYSLRWYLAAQDAIDEDKVIFKVFEKVLGTNVDLLVATDSNYLSESLLSFLLATDDQ